MTAKIQVRQDLSSQWTSVNPILSKGEFGYETDTKNLKLGDGVTAWTSLSYVQIPTKSYTPTLAQGASTNISKTVNYAKYSKSSTRVSGTVKVTASAAGTAASAITISTPITASTSGLVVGSGFYNDGGTQYQAVAYLLTTSTIALLRTDATADSAIGASPNIAVASNDIFNVSFSYEASA